MPAERSTPSVGRPPSGTAGAERRTLRACSPPDRAVRHLSEHDAEPAGSLGGASLGFETENEGVAVGRAAGQSVIEAPKPYLTMPITVRTITIITHPSAASAS